MPHDYSFVLDNMRRTLATSRFAPTIADLTTEYKEEKNEGRYIPDARTTYLELQQKEHEKRLALTTRVPNASKAEILAAKEKALREIASAVKRSEEENPYKVVE